MIALQLLIFTLLTASPDAVETTPPPTTTLEDSAR